MVMNLASAYWEKMVDMIPEFGKFSNYVNSILVDDVIGVSVKKIKNLEVIIEYTDTASQRFKQILFALDNLRDIEKNIPTHLNLDEEYEIAFKTDYHFFTFITSVASFLNSLAWLTKLIYNIKVSKPQDVDFRRNKRLLKKIRTKNPSLYNFIFKNLNDWIEEVCNFRDVLLHRREIKLIGADDRKLYMPVHPEILTYADTNFESEEKHERYTNEISRKKGGITQPLIPFCEDIVKKVVNFSKGICNSLINEIT